MSPFREKALGSSIVGPLGPWALTPSSNKYEETKMRELSQAAAATQHWRPKRWHRLAGHVLRVQSWMESALAELTPDNQKIQVYTF